MSAIFGKYNVDGKPIEREIVQKQHEIMRHWSPDTEGVWYDETVGLGHLMLHNSPESLHETQPLHDSEARLTLVADAILYNREELFRKLNITTSDSVRISDSFLILESYKKWGEKCCEHFNGDFAFVIWDARKQQIYCGRDHIGVRPFFYTYNNQFFAFGSQLRGVLAIPAVSRELNDNYIFEFLYDGYPYKKTTTFYQHIYRLEPAHYMIVTKQGVQSYKYWELDITKEIRYPKEEDYVEEARHLLRQAVNCRMRTAFPVGSQLSGGLDSSGVSILAAQEAREKNIPFSVYCNVMPEELLGKVYPYTDDRDLIHEVCRAGNITNINYIDFKDKDIDFFFEDLANDLEYTDIGNLTFFKGMARTHCEAATNNNIRTMLSGFMGDEIVSSLAFSYFYELFISFKWKILLYEFKEEKETLGLEKNYLIKWLKIIIPLHFPKILNIYSYIKYRSDIYSKSSFVNSENLPQYIKSKFWNKPLYRFNKLRVLQYETWFPNINNLRIETEAISCLKYKINKSYPLSDINVLKYFLAVPTNLKRKNGYGRYLYRRSLKGLLPDNVLFQVKSKSGYTSPALHSMLISQEKDVIECNNVRINFFVNSLKVSNYLNRIWNGKQYGDSFSVINSLEMAKFFNAKNLKNNLILI